MRVLATKEDLVPVRRGRVYFEKSKSILIGGFWFRCDTWVTDDSEDLEKQRHIRLRYSGPEGYGFSLELSGNDSSVYAEGVMAADRWIRLTPRYLRAALNFGQELNYVVVGKPCVGKSSLINVIRGMTQYDEGAAPVSFIGRAELSHPVCYEWTEDVALWDIPSPPEGTSEADAELVQETYYQQNYLAAFDTLIVLYESTFPVECSLLLAQANRWKQPVIFVRTKADVDMTKLVEMGFSKSDALKQVRKEVEEDFRRNVPVSRPIFLVSSLWDVFGVPSFDLDRLRRCIAR